VARRQHSLAKQAGDVAEYINDLDVPAYIYHLGDRDPSGVNTAEKIEETLRELAPNAEIHFERLTVLNWQIREWNPTRPTKKTDSRAKRFGHEESVELDAIDPITLRGIVEAAINRHLPPEHLAVLQAAEESEQRLITSFVGSASVGAMHE
jgi:hypothetical protein